MILGSKVKSGSSPPADGHLILTPAYFTTEEQHYGRESVMMLPIDGRTTNELTGTGRGDPYLDQAGASISVTSHDICTKNARRERGALLQLALALADSAYLPFAATRPTVSTEGLSGHKSSHVAELEFTGSVTGLSEEATRWLTMDDAIAAIETGHGSCLEVLAA